MKNSEVTARAPVTISVAETTARPEETSSKKTTKIKWTYNGVRILFPNKKSFIIMGELIFFKSNSSVA